MPKYSFDTVHNPQRFLIIYAQETKVKRFKYNSGGGQHICDLDEYVLRKIFSYLEDKEIYFTVRSVCRQFKLVAGEYVSLGNCKNNKFKLININKRPTYLSKLYKKELKY